MNFRLATMDDLPQLKAVYKKIIEHMDYNNIKIWDDVYPCEFFHDDIKNECLYILECNNVILSAFALCTSNAGADYVEWENNDSDILYIDRFGVNTDYLREGIGSIMLHNAITLAEEKGANTLRLFVVDINQPAIKLYIKNGFKKAKGVYDEIIDEDLTLHEYGFERNISL